MRQSLIFATHNAKLRHSQQNITTCKAGGFLGYNKTVFLLSIYDKSEQENIDPRDLISLLRQIPR
jgi:hypothetical protein